MNTPTMCVICGARPTLVGRGVCADAACQADLDSRHALKAALEEELRGMAQQPDTGPTEAEKARAALMELSAGESAEVVAGDVHESYCAELLEAGARLAELSADLSQPRDAYLVASVAQSFIDRAVTALAAQVGASGEPS